MPVIMPILLPAGIAQPEQPAPACAGVNFHVLFDVALSNCESAGFVRKPEESG
jgi:hypothetical protein